MYKVWSRGSGKFWSTFLSWVQNVFSWRKSRCSHTIRLRRSASLPGSSVAEPSEGPVVLFQSYSWRESLRFSWNFCCTITSHFLSEQFNSGARLVVAGHFVMRQFVVWHFVVMTFRNGTNGRSLAKKFVAGFLVAETFRCRDLSSPC